MTVQKHSDESDLPPALRKAAQELRRMEPSEALGDRLEIALIKADRESPGRRVASHRPASRTGRVLGPWLAVVPGAAAMALMLHLAFGKDANENADEMWQHVHSQDVELVLDEDGHSWVNLNLLTHHHDGQQALVRVDAPHDVKVMPPRHAKHHGHAPVCAAARCVHRFSQPTHHPRSAPLQVGVTEPGRYRISVEHASSGGRIREEFVVHARR